MKTYRVYLFYAPECKRKWLAYLNHHSNSVTCIVNLQSHTGAQAKNSAITMANKKFEGLRIIAVNYVDALWGVDKFPELEFMKGHRAIEHIVTDREKYLKSIELVELKRPVRQSERNQQLPHAQADPTG